MSRSIANTASVTAGPTHTEPDTLGRVTRLLKLTYREPLKVKSDLARYEAEIVAIAASLQLITTKIGAQRFARAWRVTTKGLAWLNEKED